MYAIRSYYVIERYYHHIFRSDSELLALIKELGLEKQMLWLEAKNAYFVDGKNYPMNTALEILHFSPLSIFDLAKLALLVLRIRLIKDTEPYDQIKAKDWIIDTAGNRCMT